MLANAKSNKKMPMEVPVQLRYFHQNKGVQIYDFLKRKEVMCYSKSAIYLHPKLPVDTIWEDQQ